MFPINYDQLLNFSTAGALIAFATVCTPVSAGDQVQNLGPVGPYAPILTTVGGKRVIAFYQPGSSHCAGLGAQVCKRHRSHG